MILEFEKIQYQEMIRQGQWGELAVVMDRQMKRGILAMSAQVMDYENLQQETLRTAQELLKEVLDPEGGSLGFRYEYTEEAWKKLEHDWELWLKAHETYRSMGGQVSGSGSAADSSLPIPEDEERFLHAMAVCHIPLHLLAVIPASVPEPLPIAAGLAWVYAGEEALTPGYSGVLCSDNGVEAHFRITSAGRRGEHPAAGGYTAYDAEGYVTGYTVPQDRPLTVELYNAYPEDVMIRFTSVPGDEYAYRKHWEAYFSWQEHSEATVHAELERDLIRVSASMQSEGGQGRPGRDERSYDDGPAGYGQSRPGSFGYDGGGSGAYGGYGNNGGGYGRY